MPRQPPSPSMPTSSPPSSEKSTTASTPPPTAVGHGYAQSTTRRSSAHTTLPTGSPSYATRMSCPTSAGYRQHRLIRSLPIGSIGKRSSHYPSTIPSGPSTTLATGGTANAHSNRPTIPSTDPMTSTVSTLHSADSRTTLERTAIPSPTTTRTSQAVVARARSITIASITVSTFSSITKRNTASSAVVSIPNCQIKRMIQ